MYPAGKPKQTKGLKFPLILFFSPTPYLLFFFVKHRNGRPSCEKHLSLLAANLFFRPLFCFFSLVREALKLCQLFVTSRDIMLFLSCLSSPAKREILTVCLYINRRPERVYFSNGFVFSRPHCSCLGSQQVS